jgi:hypothetical protein
MFGRISDGVSDVGTGQSVRTDRGWKRPFEDPIPLPRGRQLVTLKDAADYITRLRKAEHASMAPCPLPPARKRSPSPKCAPPAFAVS